MKAAIVALTTLVLLAGCSGPGNSATSSTNPAAPATPKRITAAIMSNPPTISAQGVLAGGGTYPGGDALVKLLNGSLTAIDTQGNRLPDLAEEVPSLENGLWKVFPDGRMETTWKLRPNAVWHDGEPITAADVLFVYELERDQELPFFADLGWRSAQDISAPNDHTVVIRWRQTLIRADAMFKEIRPRHILEPAYRADNLSVLQHPYWTEQYVGLGPFKVKEWVSGSHIVASAYDQYFLGRPKLDEILIRFIPEPSTIISNILASEVELTMGRNISVQQGMQLRDHWQNGRIDIGLTNWIALYPQFINPNPPILANRDFRRAVITAIDRQQIIDTLLYGAVPLAHSFLSPTEPIYPAVEPSIVKYDYAPSQSAQMLAGLGLQKGADGLLRDSSGQMPPVEVRTSADDDTHIAGVLAVVDALKRVGIPAEPYFISQSERGDRAADTSYAALRLWRLPNAPEDLTRYSSAQAGTPENQFRQTANRARYINAELDALIDRYMTTISEHDRVPFLA
ncbi:MAG TPA: ABC transporter substrate-binding protein, partial [Chloroflexota bacterium]